MVEIGRALVLTPALLLMDEPASGLSITEMGNLWKAMGSIKEKGEVAVISAEHTLGFILGISDRITVLNKGQKIAEGNPDEIKENEEVIKVYLGEKEN
jgi:branched-chain amino acid transport system ATP-binding protein